MANESKSSYTRIGLTIVLGALAIVGTLVYLGGAGSSRDEMLVETVYDSPVTGLSPGSAVNFRGVRVGEVRKISFVGSEFDDVSESDLQKIYILMALDRHLMRLEEDESALEVLNFHLDHGLAATVSANGVTGLARIELNYHPKEQLQQEEPSWISPYPYIPSAPSMLESFSRSAQRMMAQINRIDFMPVWTNVAATLDSLRHLTDRTDELIESERGRVSTILENLEGATSSLRDLSESLRSNPSLLLRAADPEPLRETQP